MAGYPPPYPPSSKDWKYQRRILRDQARAQRDQYRYQMRGTRRSSILGPVIVVLVGVVFLLIQTGHLRNERLWEWYGHWWPLLLVVAGVVLLIEWGVDQVRPRSTQQPYLRRSIGGGVVLLVILLAVTGILFNGIHSGRDYFARGFSINPDNIEEFLGDKHESDQSLMQVLAAGGALTIDNPHGDVTITGSSSDNQVHVSIHKQVYSRSDTDAEHKARSLTPQIVTTGKLLSMTLPTLSGASADLTITIPPTTAVTVNTNHGDVHIDSLKAPLTVTANHGDVNLSAIAGPVLARVNSSGSSFSAHSITGMVSLEGHAKDVTISDISGPVNLSGDFYGTTHLEHVASPLKFHTSRTDFQLARLDGEMDVSSGNISADQAGGPVVLTTSNRNVSLERMSGELSVTNRNGSVDLTSAPPLGNVTVQNRHGSVNLTVPDHANFIVNAVTTDGDITNDFSLPTQDADSRKTLGGTVGKGGSMIRIDTSQGDVSIKRASIAPLPPTPPAPPHAPAPISITGDDGSSVYVGKDGVRIISGSDGSSVIVGKDGLKITANADGSSVYKSKDGTQLTEGADGSKVFVGRDGTHFTQGADGSKVYKGRDGTHIAIGADGSQTATAPRGHTLSEDEIQKKLLRVQGDIESAEKQRDADRRERHGRNGNQ